MSRFRVYSFQASKAVSAFRGAELTPGVISAPENLSSSYPSHQACSERKLLLRCTLKCHPWCLGRKFALGTRRGLGKYRFQSRVQGNLSDVFNEYAPFKGEIYAASHIPTDPVEGLGCVCSVDELRARVQSGMEHDE